MQIGFVGLGRLGLPIAVAISKKFRVYGYDSNPDRNYHRRYEHKEAGPEGGEDFQIHFDLSIVPGDGLGETGLSFCKDLPEVVRNSDIIFLAVQTSHHPRFGGTQRMNFERSDFNYTHLVKAAGDLASLVHAEQIVAIVSTVLPGTIRREIIPVLENTGCEVMYNPFFVSSGTVMYDFLNPEFILVGHSTQHPVWDNPVSLAVFYTELFRGKSRRVPFLSMSLESAELAKVCYNAFIGQKISFLNSMMEIAQKIPKCNVNEATEVFEHSPRLIYRFNKAGMGFGGTCLPRDCLAMSWLAEKLNISCDPFEAIMYAREEQTFWLATLIRKKAEERGLPIVILGKSFKGNVGETAGSSAVLLASFLKEQGIKFEHWDPLVDQENAAITDPALYFVASRHDAYLNFVWPLGSVVIDPWRYIPRTEGIEVIQVGVG